MKAINDKNLHNCKLENCIIDLKKCGSYLYKIVETQSMANRNYAVVY